MRPKGTRTRSPLIVRFGAVSFGATVSALPRYFAADAEDEIREGRESDQEADNGVEAFEGDDGDPAKGAVIRHGVAEERD